MTCCCTCRDHSVKRHERRASYENKWLKCDKEFHKFILFEGKETTQKEGIARTGIYLHFQEGQHLDQTAAHIIQTICWNQED